MGEEELVGERVTGHAGTADRAVPHAHARFLGGPLDGRWYPFVGDEYPTEGHVVTHVYLHEGPKIETRYRLTGDADGGWTYHLTD